MMIPFLTSHITNTMLLHKPILIVLLFFLSPIVCAQNAIDYDNVPEEISLSLNILEDKLDKEEPLLRKIEWQSFYVKAEKNTQLITAATEHDKNDTWDAAPWRDATAKLIALLEKAEGILQQRKQDNESLLESFSNQSNHPTLTTELQENKQAVELALQTTSSKLTQLRIIKQRLINADKYFAKYQHKALNQTINKADKFSVFDPDTYQTANRELHDYLKQIRRSKLLESGSASLMPLFTVWLGYWIWIFISQYTFNRKHHQKPHPLTPYSYKRVLLASMRMLVKTALFTLMAVIFLVSYIIMQLDGIDEETITSILNKPGQEKWIVFAAQTFLLIVFSYVLVNLVRYLSSSKYRFFNMLPMSTNATSQLSLLAILIIFAQLFNVTIVEVSVGGAQTEPGTALVFLLNTVALFLTATLLFLIARKACWTLTNNNTEQFRNNLPVVLMQYSLFFLKVAALSAIALIFVQRSSLADYIVNTIQFTICALFSFFLVKDFLRDFIYSLEDGNGILASLEIKQETLRNILHLAYMATLAYLSYFWLVKLAAFWGMPEADINQTVNRLWNGFSIGNIDISLYNILSALVVLVGLIFLNNIIKRALGKALQDANKFSPGSRASITAALGYVGIIIAVTASIAVLGVNLTNIALIASGLTLGIGFGLQTIVSNFVSGLILLMERPVSIGDWVIVDGNEGIVSDIRFRATEIKTFDKASVLVPNSSFISNVVTNMTHQEQILRITIPIGVAYDSDVDQVESVLLQCIEDLPGILKTPEPNVFFMNFGDSSLDFELRCFTNDALNSLKLASQLRFKINRAFKEGNIVIPFPQRVIQMENVAEPIRPVP